MGLAPVRLHVPVAVGVEDAELHGVHADLVRQLVHLHLEREVDAGDAEAAHGGGRGTVGEDAEHVGVHVRDGVGPGDVGCALDGAVAGEAGVGPSVEVAADLARDDAAIAHHAVLDVVPLGPARAAVEHFLLAAEHIAHGAPGQHGAENGERLGQAVDLAAEAAADRAADEV